MKGTFAIVEPAKVDLELTVTMTLEDWVELKININGSMSPAHEFCGIIDCMVDKANLSLNSDSESCGYGHQDVYPKDHHLCRPGGGRID